MFTSDELNLAQTSRFVSAYRQLKIDRAKFSPGQVNNIKFLHRCLAVEIDFGKTDPRDSMISYIYFIGQCFEFNICLFYEINNLKSVILL